MTKKNYIETIKSYLETNTLPAETSIDDLIKFCCDELDRLEKKAAVRKETPKAIDDELTAALREALTEEFESIKDITERLNREDATISKVTFRLNALATNGEAEKSDMTVTTDGKKRTIKSFRAVVD
jgi:hypothetical protein